jgi:hypothetical protein
MVPSASLPELAVHNRVTDAIVRYRKVFFIGIALLYIISFNGRWRIGLDSSIYRGLGHHLATGRGYTFGASAAHQVYPGLPIVLAGIERYISASVFFPVVPVLFVLACAVLTLIITYKLIRLHFPEWIAVAVTCGVAINERFLQHANEILTDVPFVLGVVLALYGWSLLNLATDRKKIIKSIVVLLIGLGIAAIMRPTFWILAISWFVVCLFGLFTPRRKIYAIALVSMLAICALFVAIDPRTSGIHPFAGLYEREFLSVLQDPDSQPSPNDQTRAPSLVTRFRMQAPELFRDSFPESFLGQNLPWGLSYGFSVVLIIAAIMLMWRQPIWGLMILLTIAITSILSTTPRYYIMVLPMLLTAWVILVCAIARRLPAAWAEVFMLAALGMVTVLNIVKITPFVFEQRRTPFYEKYRDGKFVPEIEMAKLIAQHVPPGQKVLAPASTLMGYLSDRLCVTDRDILPARVTPMHWPDAAAKAHLDYAVFPKKEYKDKDEAIARLMERGVIRPLVPIASIPSGSLYLATVHVIVPKDDWRKLPLRTSVAARKAATTRHATTRKAKRKPPTTAQLRHWRATTQPKEKKKKHPTPAQIRHWRATTRAAARHPTTQPSTAPANAP